MNTTTSSTATNTPTQSARPHRGRRILRRIGLGILGFIGVLLACAVIGMVYEAIMAPGDAQRYPPPGLMADAGGHRLHIHCMGTGSPTVIFESGSKDTSLTWETIQPTLAQTTRACAYDRAGLAWSEVGPEPRSPQQIATELHTALGNAGIAGPYVLVGHSIAGKYVRMFAALYPQDVAGMVLEDARHESAEPVGRTPEEIKETADAINAGLRQYKVLRQFGIARVFGSQLATVVNPVLKAVSPETRGLMVLFATSASMIEAEIAEDSASLLNDDQLSASSLGDLPLVVLVSSQGAAQPGWVPAQEKNAALSTNSRLEIVEGSDHYIHYTNPDVVVDAIQQVVEAVRTGQPLAQK